MRLRELDLALVRLAHVHELVQDLIRLILNAIPELSEREVFVVVVVLAEQIVEG